MVPHWKSTNHRELSSPGAGRPRSTGVQALARCILLFVGLIAISASAWGGVTLLHSPGPKHIGDGYSENYTPPANSRIDLILEFDLSFMSDTSRGSSVMVGISTSGNRLASSTVFAGMN
jgi:hypothetical protein